MIFTLIKNELIKISKRSKTWIVFALFAICVVGIGIISNIDAKNIAYNNTPEGRIESLNSSIQYAEDHLKELETYKDKWAEEAIEEQKQYIISLKEEIKLQEERKKNPDDPNLWRKTLEQEKKNIQEVLDDTSYPDRYKTHEKQRTGRNKFIFRCWGKTSRRVGVLSYKCWNAIYASCRFNNISSRYCCVYE
ncbi:MAG: hypothetical protein ACLR3R_00635 [Clostridium paraputrificum]